MRAATVIIGVLAITFGVCAQKVPPDAPPAAATKSGNRIGQLNGTEKAGEGQQNGPAKTNIVSCVEQSPCYVITEPKAPTEQEKEQANSLDHLYRLYMKATIWGVIGAFIGIGVLIWQTVISRTAARAALLNAQAVIKSERAWVDGELRRPTRPLSIRRWELVIKNHGKTPAHVESYEIASELFGEKVNPDDLGRTIWPLNFLLGSEAERSIGDLIDMDRLFPRGDGLKTGAYCVWINYSDSVSEGDPASSKHRTFFMYYYRQNLQHIERVPVDKYT